MILYFFNGIKKDAIPDKYLKRWKEYQLVLDLKIDKMRGVLLGKGGKTPPKYDAKLFRLDEIEENIYVAVKKDAKPEDFLREAPLNPSYSVTLADKNEWRIPVANPLVESCSFDSYDVIKKGTWTKEIVDEYKDLSWEAAEMANKFRAALVESVQTLNIEDAELRTFIAKFINLNYDLTIEEMSALRLFKSNIYYSAVAAVIDWPAMIRLMETEKKTGEIICVTNDTNSGEKVC